VFMWTYTLPSDRSVEILNEAGYPLFTGARGCAGTMRAMADYRALRERISKQPAAAAQPHAAREQVRGVLDASGAVLAEWQARPLLALYGIGEDAGTLARSAKEAEKAAKALRRPAALKVQSADIPHKTEAGAVSLAIAAENAAAAYDTVLANARRFAPQAKIDGVLVQPMAKSGREVILGVNRDDRWGPLLMVGLGGTLVEAMGDIALAPVPLDRSQALALIASLKAAPVFGAWRGMPEADTGALADLMVKLGQFAVDHAEDVAEIDLNPVIVHAKGEGISVVDALIVKRDARAARRTAAE
jgi:acyl-CoA synthetase (NDP forming)